MGVVRIRKSIFAIIASAVLLVASLPLTLVDAATSNSRERQFQAAAKEFGVPVDILKSISYNQTRWEHHDGEPSSSGGFGLMHLTTDTEVEDGRGDPSRPVQARDSGSQNYTLDQAADLLDLPAKEIKKDATQNIRGAAAVLAKYAKEYNDGALPVSIDEWYASVALFADATTSESAEEFAEVVYDTINTGAALTTTDGYLLSIGPRDTTPDRSGLDNIGLPNRVASNDEEAECPDTITCKWVPARFAQNDPDDPYDYGNYDVANREEDMDIQYIVIHDTEGSYQSAIDWYQDPSSYVSAHYTIRSSDGEVTQSVKNKDVAWHAGNWYMNSHSIGIEHEGYAAEGATWFTEALYRSSAELVRYLADKYNISLDREHIVGHDQYQAVKSSKVSSMHWDPGPYWDWDHYMDLLRQPTLPQGNSNSNAVTINPTFKSNKPVVTKCEGEDCEELASQSANFVYLRTEPNNDSPLITDAGLHSDGSPGTTRIEDWSAKATQGMRYAVAGRQGDWTAIWFNGQKAWFYNPGFGSWGQNTLPTKAKLITPKEGKESVPVYGRPLPEADAYPDDVPVQSVVALQYTIPAGQSYVAYEPEAINDYYHSWTFDQSGSGDGTVVIGNETYIPIVYNHRQAFVKASDVKFIL